MSEGPEFLGGEVRRGELDVAGFDQEHSQAMELLRETTGFVLAVYIDRGDKFAVRFKSVVPPEPDIIAAFADTLEGVVAELRRGA